MKGTLNTILAQLDAVSATVDALKVQVRAAMDATERAADLSGDEMVDGAAFGISVITWRKATRSGDIEGARKIGKKYMAPRRSVLAWIASRNVPKAPVSKVRTMTDDEADLDALLDTAFQGKGRAA